jgi:RNA polymerase sigma-70 factor (ECF subfamily)
MTSEELAARGQAGDRSALTCLVARHKHEVYRVALRLVRHPMEAEEILQNTLERLLRHLTRYDPQRPFRPWLMRITINQTRSYMRLRRVRLFFSPTPPEAPWTHVGQSGAERAAQRRSSRRLLEEAIDSLPRKQREVFVLKHVEGLSYDEIAAIVGDTVGSLKVRNHRTRQAILDFFEKRGVTLAALSE